MRPRLFHTSSGSCNVQKFRSPAEFAPHALWLLNDPSLENSNCLCKYCEKKRTGSAKSPIPVVSGSTPPSSFRTRNVSKTSSSLTQVSRSPTKEAGRVFRLAQVPLVSDPADPLPGPFEIGSTFYREGEIVWLILDKSLLFDSVEGPADGFIIRFWPCIVEIDEDDTDDTGMPRGQGMPSSAFLRVRLFSSGIAYFVPQHNILPFSAYSPDGLWLQRLQLRTSGFASCAQDPFAGLVKIAEDYSRGTTAPTSSPEELLLNFLSDVNISLEISRFWSIYPVTPSPLFPGPTATSQRNPSTVHARHHELWWGGERIVVGDLVRLRVQESKLHQTSESHKWFVPRQLPESSAAAASVEHSEAEEGQLFFKLRTLLVFKTEIGKELRAFGGLYRLVSFVPGLLPPLDTAADSEQPVLPRPPEGFAFQPALAGGWEIELSLHYIDGRYYPRIQETLTEPSGVDAHTLEALEGVVCWRVPPSRPRHSKKGSRKELIAQTMRRLQKM